MFIQLLGYAVNHSSGQLYPKNTDKRDDCFNTCLGDRCTPQASEDMNSDDRLIQFIGAERSEIKSTDKLFHCRDE